jgi:hypothetical protein
MNTKINYPEEVLMKDQPIGTVFACGQKLWMKINQDESMELGSGAVVSITRVCRAKVVKTLEGEV